MSENNGNESMLFFKKKNIFYFLQKIAVFRIVPQPPGFKCFSAGLQNRNQYFRVFVSV